MNESCGVPGCLDPREVYDSCFMHSQPDYGHCRVFAPNDGIIDWVAINVAVQGARKVNLTWVEFEIAAGTALARGLTIKQACARIGIEFRSRGPRRESIERIRDVLLRGEAAV